MHLNYLLERKANSNASLVTLKLLKELNVPVTASTVIDTIESHPDYPNLYSISDSLEKWKVENLALKVQILFTIVKEKDPPKFLVFKKK